MPDDFGPAEKIEMPPLAFTCLLVVAFTEISLAKQNLAEMSGQLMLAITT